MNYIYCYINKVNNHKYVGQTNNLQRRIREHKSCAFNPKSVSYNDLIHKKIRQYGLENFTIDILETLYKASIEEVNNREIYWIAELETYCAFGKGYNMDRGGGKKGRSYLLTDEELIELKTQIKAGVAYYDLEKQFSISTSFISSINTGVYFFDENESYPLYQYYKSDNDYDELIDLLENSSYSLRTIAHMLNMGESTVKKINEGRLRKGLYPTYPIRKQSIYEQRANKVKDLLMNTTLTYAQITELTGASDDTIRRIRIGQCFKDEKLTYPLRNL